MDAKDILKRVKKALKAGDVEKSEEISALKKALEALNKRKKQLKRDLESADGGKERKRIEDRLEVNRAHRKKALKLIRKIKKNN
jgi:predicted  nucleic acid-binding Zn-ribbon protein